MRKLASVLLGLLLVMLGCRSSNVNPYDNAPRSDNQAPRSDNQALSRKSDFSTPRATAETFLAAAQARDVELLSQCMASEVKMVKRFNVQLRDKTLSPQELDLLAQVVDGAQIIDQKLDEEAGRSDVRIKFGNVSTDNKISNRPIDKLQMKKTADGWKIYDVG